MDDVVTKAFVEYLELYQEMVRVRNEGTESEAYEDALMDDMDVLWWKMPDHEIEFINQLKHVERALGPVEVAIRYKLTLPE